MSEIQKARDEVAKVEPAVVSIYHKVADWIVKYKVYLAYVLGVGTSPLVKALYHAAKAHYAGK